jgi:hypothetical protein
VAWCHLHFKRTSLHDILRGVWLCKSRNRRPECNWRNPDNTHEMTLIRVIIVELVMRSGQILDTNGKEHKWI